MKGRLHSTTLKQKVDNRCNGQRQTMQQKIDQKIDVKVTPAGEKKADEAKKSEPSEKKTTEEKK